MTRTRIAAAVALSAALVTSIATSPPYYGEWSVEDSVDALQFTMEADEDLRAEELRVVTSGGLEAGYWGNVQLDLLLDNIEFTPLEDEDEDDTGEDTGASPAEPPMLAVVILQDGQELSRELISLEEDPDTAGDIAPSLQIWPDTSGCTDVGDCTLPFDIEFQLDRPLFEGETLLVDWSASARLWGEFTDEDQTDPQGLSIEIQLAD